MQRIKKDDLVEVISGNEKGERGEVEEIILAWYIDRRTKKRLGRDKNRDFVRVSGLNVRKKHKKKSSANTQGEIVEIRAPIHVSNVMLVCSDCNEATRVGFREVDGKKIRFCKLCNENID
ncbi:50S ribosomal protein L24 [Anaerolineales bacterium HSG6]|nr:50S ribosomal protein L24 [Anaerolineales bacterium HSG6]MDM8530077.1 50S ribosomal protein L24 [Anaerolineales bacterium HSG25]